MQIKPYIESSEFIDSDNRSIKEQAKILSDNLNNDLEIAKRCFGMVNFIRTVP